MSLGDVAVATSSDFSDSAFSFVHILKPSLFPFLMLMVQNWTKRKEKQQQIRLAARGRDIFFLWRISCAVGMLGSGPS